MTTRATASPQTLRAERDHGSATAWQMTEHGAANGRSADAIEERHQELSGPTADQHEQTVAESTWWSGYQAGADGSVSVLRDLEKSDREAGA